MPAETPTSTATQTSPPMQQIVPTPTPTRTAVPPVNTATTPPIATQQATIVAAAPTPEIQTETVPLLPVAGRTAGVAALVLLSLGLVGLGIMLRRTQRRSF